MATDVCSFNLDKYRINKIVEDSNDVLITSRSKREIDLSFLPYDEELKNEILHVYNKLSYQTHKGELQTKILYACTYVAHLLLERPFVEIQLAKQFKLDNRKIAGANAYIVTARQRGLCDGIKTIDAMKLADLYLKEKNIYEKYHEVCLEFSQSIKKQINQPNQTAVYILDSCVAGSRKEILGFFGLSEILYRSFISKYYDS